MVINVHYQVRGMQLDIPDHKRNFPALREEDTRVRKIKHFHFRTKYTNTLQQVEHYHR